MNVGSQGKRLSNTTQLQQGLPAVKLQLWSKLKVVKPRIRELDKEKSQKIHKSLGAN